MDRLDAVVDAAGDESSFVLQGVFYKRLPHCYIMVVILPDNCPVDLVLVRS